MHPDEHFVDSFRVEGLGIGTLYAETYEQARLDGCAVLKQRVEAGESPGEFQIVKTTTIRRGV